MAAKRKGLGKGINNLIPETDVIRSTPKKKTEKKEVVKEVVKEVIKEVKVPVPGDTMMKISDIEPNREQPRKNFDKEALQELADSIKQFGIIQPIVVQKKDDYYEIIAGERRWRAAKLAKLKEVPVIIKEYSNREVMEIALIENIQRKDLNPIEEALAYKSLIDEYSLKQEELANRVSKSRTAIANSMRLLKLTDSVQNMLINDEISMGHARALLTLEQEDLQIEAAKTIVSKGLSVRDTEKLVKSILNPKQVKLPIPSAEAAIYDAIANKLREKMGTKVSINHKKNGKGKIEIEYYSQEELERLLEMFDDIKE
ncbi:ParB/RepB/Spo0J family partition protein [Eubacterium sp.]|jgi:ParB family chromosome partitioning protein|uniref:ParB/RepB/Spo0J family partition protein n=1 Tax=Eubacterium sp. TaxID=142586 RepID=UPI003520C995